MNLSKVKTYLIIILLVANALLAVLFLQRYFSEAATMRQANEQIIELLAKQGVIVSDLPSETVPVLVLSRDFAAERTAAAALLGDVDSVDMGGGAYECQNGAGQALFRSGGRFEIKLNNGPVYSDYEKTCRDLLSSMGFLNASEMFLEDDIEDGGVSLTFGQTVEKKHLYNARAVFSFSESGQLLSVSGLWALGTTQITDSTPCKSAGAVLLLFSVNHDAEIISVEQGYRLRTQTSESAKLAPEWRVICEDFEYYLDGFTGAEIVIED